MGVLATANKGVIATAKGVNMSPRKVGVVAALVRGRSVDDALVILSHVPRASAIPVRKAIESARANADHNHNLKPDTLQITEISVTPGVRLKRFRPAAQGRALPFQRRTSHIRVIVDGEARVSKKAKAEAVASETTKTKKEAK
ncbi:MAG: 50S ribosomal protein L22 [Candidatus Saccharibacteria bacterium]|nr:50S ribosomal protein L22 [Candidatus Saccharibacteria bacterium]